jgi:hypothetical protein
VRPAGFSATFSTGPGDVAQLVEHLLCKHTGVCGVLTCEDAGRHRVRPTELCGQPRVPLRLIPLVEQGPILNHDRGNAAMKGDGECVEEPQLAKYRREGRFPGTYEDPHLCMPLNRLVVTSIGTLQSKSCHHKTALGDLSHPSRD